jgi:hypothetical protein
MHRITDLTDAPVVGQFYVVPTICGALWHDGQLADWPVLLPGHADAQFFPHFPWSHHHVDPRFVDRRWWKELGSLKPGASEDARAEKSLQSWPVSLRDRLGPPAPIVWRRRKCQRSAVAYQHHDKEPPRSLKAHFAGQQCARNRTGWVCPHQHYALGSIAPAGGVITCPMHGLQIDVETGRVLAADGAAETAREKDVAA